MSEGKIEFERDWQGAVVVGADECNYNTSMAGDCVAAACWLPLSDPIPGIDDSKRLTHRQRLELFGEICRRGLFWAVPAPAAMISRVGLKQARDLALAMAVEGLATWLLTARILELGGVITVLVDGRKDRCQVELIRAGLGASQLIGTVEHIVDGDQKSYLVGAASIVAKVYVDALFCGYEAFWPGYGIGHNHGSMSEEHRRKVAESGFSPVHRWGYGTEWWRRLVGAGRYEELVAPYAALRC